jgi:surface antigen-like variable number repeat protein
VRDWTVAGARMAPVRMHPADGLLHSGEFCSCLFAERRDAERAGILDFSVKLNVQRVTDGDSDSSGAPPVADLTASVDEGQPYRVGRIEITGNRHFADGTVRRNLLLDEGQWFDERLLRKSIARLNQTTWFEPVEESEIVIHSHPNTGEADVSIQLTERRRRAWAISGPLGPASFAGPLQASISSRLPAWGRGMFELSTYTASVSLLAFAHPLLPFLSASAKWPLLGVLALQRPYTPGEGWKSGFVFAPQLGWRSSALSYASTQIQHRLVPVLAGERGLEPLLPVAVERPQGNVMLLCEPLKPRLAGLRSAAALVVQFLGALPSL